MSQPFLCIRKPSWIRTFSKCINRESRSPQSSNAYSRAVMRPWSSKFKRTGAVGFKLGMMSYYDQWGRRHPVTVIRVIRSFPVGEAVIQEVGAGAKKARQLHSAQQKLYEKIGVGAKLSVQGFSVSSSALLPIGTTIYAAHFVPGQFVDVQSKSIGKGFQGAMVRWGFKGLPASHGVSLAHRHLGATGCRSDPGRVFKGKKMAGRMGGKNVTHKNLLVIKIDNVLNCIFVRGCVGGHDTTPVKIMDSRRNPSFETTPPPYPTFIPDANRELPRVMMITDPSKDTLKIDVPE